METRHLIAFALIVAMISAIALTFVIQRRRKLEAERIRRKGWRR